MGKSEKVYYGGCGDRTHDPKTHGLSTTPFRSATPLATTVYVAIRVNGVILGSLCAEAIKPVSEGDKI